jgi:hypothetical protein
MLVNGDYRQLMKHRQSCKLKVDRKSAHDDFETKRFKQGKDMEANKKCLSTYRVKLIK